MREAVGNAYLFYFVIIFVSIFIAILAGSLSYSKAFKVKNNIINIIEEDGGWIKDSTEGKINTMLGQIGYSVAPQNITDCGNVRGDKREQILHNRNKDYLYCVYQIEENRGIRYRVVTYIYFDIPVINEVFRVPVQGETATLIDLD